MVIRQCLNEEAERVRQHADMLPPGQQTYAFPLRMIHAHSDLPLQLDGAPVLPGIPYDQPSDVHPDTLRGRYLCEGCGEVMTDAIVPPHDSPTGEEMALCVLCQRTVKK